MRRISLLLFSLIILAVALPAQPPARPRLPDPLGYVCYRAAQPITIDGGLVDSAS
jgi:hypothetical protein